MSCDVCHHHHHHRRRRRRHQCSGDKAETSPLLPPSSAKLYYWPTYLVLYTDSITVSFHDCNSSHEKKDLWEVDILVALWP